MSVPKLWPGSTVVCIGGGPSLTQADVDFCRGRARVVVVNDGYRLAPWAEILYACDDKWWKWQHRHHTAAIAEFQGLRFGLKPIRSEMIGPSGLRAHVSWVRSVQILEDTGDSGLEVSPTGLKTGRNSGYQAINLAVHLGAVRIALLGYDMSVAPDGKQHWFGKHPEFGRSPYASFQALFPTIVKPLKRLGVEVFNCSRRTALECFPKVSLEQALTQREVAA